MTRYPATPVCPAAIQPDAILRIAMAVLLAGLNAGCEDQTRKPRTGVSLVVGNAQAQQLDLVIPPAAMSGAMAPADEAFALFIASSSLAQLEGARTVLKSSNNPGVIDFAQRIVRESNRTGEDLKRIVSPRGLELPSAPTGRHADMVTKFAGVSAAERDDAFLQRFGIDAQKEAIALTERQVKEGADPALKQYAGQLIVVLREHMSLAQKLAYAAAAR